MDEACVHSELAEIVLAELNGKQIWKDVQEFAKWKRYSGSKDGEKAAKFIEDRMEKLGLEQENEKYSLYRSLPIKGNITISDGAENKTFPLTPYVYSGVANHLKAEVIFDEYSTKAITAQNMEAKRCQKFKGKIVLTYDATYDFACLAHKYGAIGILNIWHADLAHHGSLGGVWGTPGTDDMHRYPFIPYAEILHSDGEFLKNKMSEGTVIVELNIEMDNSIVKSTMPIAKIKGKSNKYVLVSGHYDSWYEGITDNAVANASMMELARVLKKHEGELERSVVFAWWTGHSDARYSGSTFYYDKHWQEINENCVAHINMDIAGCKTSDKVELNTSGIEGASFNSTFLTQFNEKPPSDLIPMARFADQTFWGANVPIAIMPRFTKNNVDNGIFYWWHTAEDTLDKVSIDVLLRDSKVIAKLVCIFANTPQLPIKFHEFIMFMEKRIKTIEEQLNSDFDITPIYNSLNKINEATDLLMSAAKGRIDTDDILKKVAGILTRLVYTYSDEYKQDRAVAQPLFPVLSRAMGQNPSNTTDDYYLFLQNDFVRQRNRVVGELNKAVEVCENQMLRWSLEK